MAESSDLAAAIDVLENNRGALGDAVVDAALGALRLAQAGSAPAPKAERKVVTIVFADISGFTALSEVMDPEHVRDLLNACFDRLVPAIERRKRSAIRSPATTAAAVLASASNHSAPFRSDRCRRRPMPARRP